MPIIIFSFEARFNSAAIEELPAMVLSAGSYILVIAATEM